jgi:hypothetical protein
MERRLIEYVVMPHEKAWTVRRDEKFYGPYSSRDAALASALDAAHTSGRNDRAAQVLIQEENGERHTQWTYGLDRLGSRSRYVPAISLGDSAAHPAWPNAYGWNRLTSSVLAWSRSWAPF